MASRSSGLSDRRIGLGERGVALLMALLLLLVLSVLVASLMLMAQSETGSTASYKYMAQTRYAAEAAANSAIDFLINAYTPPASPFGGYTMNVSPVSYGGQPVVLSSDADVPSNYPLPATVAAFQAATSGTLDAGGIQTRYAATARLVWMRPITQYGSAVQVAAQRWLVTGIASVSGARTARSEVTATLERNVTSTFRFAAFASSPGCAALAFSGNTDSYDSTDAGHEIETTGGNVGTNGNLTMGGSATINGTLSTPRTGYGTCGIGTVTAATLGGSARVSGGLVRLSQQITFETPPPPSPAPPETPMAFTKHPGGCGGFSGCIEVPDGVALAPWTALAPNVYGNISMGAGGDIHLSAGTYIVNSITLQAGATLTIDSGPVVLKVAGAGSGTPLDLGSGHINNASLDPSLVQIEYAGTGNIALAGHAASAAALYAPNAAVTMAGSAEWYGAIIAGTLNNSGNTTLHYDRHLATRFHSLGSYIVHSFSWKKY